MSAGDETYLTLSRDNLSSRVERFSHLLHRNVTAFANPKAAPLSRKAAPLIAICAHQAQCKLRDFTSLLGSRPLKHEHGSSSVPPKSPHRIHEERTLIQK